MGTSKDARAAIYARISRDKKDDGATLDGQIELCQKLAERLNLTVVAEYREADGTGASEKSKAKVRKQYRAMLNAANAGDFEYILAYSDDRITRKPLELEELIGLVDRTGLKLRTVRTEHYDLSTTQGITTARILGAVAAGEARTISDRQKVTFERNARAGHPKIQRQRPFGWNEDGITLREDEAQVIREAIKEIKEGAPVSSIRNQWNKAGILTAADGAWNWNVVHRVITGWRTAGVRTYNRAPLTNTDGSYVMGRWTPIISLQERTEALAALKRHSRIKLRSGLWPLAGLLRCSECSKPLYGQLPSGSRSRAIYACRNGHVAISAGMLEQHLISESVQRAYKTLASDASINEARPNDRTEWPQLGRLEAVTLKINEIMEAYRNDQLPGAIAFEQVDALEEERKTLQKELDAFLEVNEAPKSPLRRTSEALEWLQDVQGQFLRITPERPKEWSNQPWGSSEGPTPNSHGRMEELPYEAGEEETAELNKLLRAELKLAIIKRGKAGRQSSSTFQARIDPVWWE